MPAVLTATEPDAALLAAFAAADDQAAFAELVRRHGPLVDGVCRRVLAPGPDADDAYQATFLVLARRAGELRNPEQLGPWLYGVAVRCARRARGVAARRKSRERPMFDVPANPRPDDWSEVRPLLDAEIDRLPEKLRAALVLCELQGVSRTKAAAQLGIPEGTLSSRVARAKDALRARLVRQGVTLTGVGLAVVLGKASASAAPLPAAVVPSAPALGLAQLETTMIAPTLLGKLALAFLTAALVGLAALLVGPPKPEPAADKAKLVGKWAVTGVIGDGNLRPAYGPGKSVFEFAADGTASYWLSPDGGPDTGTWSVDAAAAPKRLTVALARRADPKLAATTLTGPYEFDGDKLRFASDGGNPTGNKRVDGTGKQVALVLERLPTAEDRALAAEKAKFVGKWEFRTFLDADGKPKAFDFGGGGPATFNADGTTSQDDEISVLGFGDWAWTLDTAATPKRLKLSPTGNRPNREPYSMAYRFDGERLVLIQEKGMGTSDLVTQLEKSQDVQGRRKAELKKLAGTWEIVSFELDGKKGGKLPGPQQMTLTADGTVTAGDQRGMFSIDPDAKPKRSTLAGLAPDTTDPTRIVVVKRIYELTGDTLRFANDQTGQEFPAGFAPPPAPAAMQHLVTTYRRVPPPEDKEKAERAKFVGRWGPATLQGEAGLTATYNTGLDATFRADGTLVARGFGTVGDGKWSLDAAAKRLTLTTTPPGDPKGKPKAVTADYGFDGDRLTLKFFGKGDDSPYPDPKADGKVPRLVMIAKLSDADAKKVAEDEGQFVGRWRVNQISAQGKLAEREITKAPTLAFRTDGTVSAENAPNLGDGTFALDVGPNPRRVTLTTTPAGGAAPKSVSAGYVFERGFLTLTFAGKGDVVPFSGAKAAETVGVKLTLTRVKDDAAEKLKAEQARLVGRWALRSLTTNSALAGEDGERAAVATNVRFAGPATDLVLGADGKLSVQNPNVVAEGTWTSDADAERLTMTLALKANGAAPAKGYAATYRLDGEKLTLAFAKGSERPPIGYAPNGTPAGAMTFERADPAAAEKLKAERAKFVGDWRTVSRQVGARDEPIEGTMASRERFTFATNRTATLDDKGKAGLATFAVDPARSPKWLTWKRNPNGGELLAIYEFLGDDLRVCVAAPGKPRPTKFAPKDDAGNDQTLMVLRKVPAEAKADPAAKERAKFVGVWTPPADRGTATEFRADGTFRNDSLPELAAGKWRVDAAVPPRLLLDTTDDGKLRSYQAEYRFAGERLMLYFDNTTANTPRSLRAGKLGDLERVEFPLTRPKPKAGGAKP